MRSRAERAADLTTNRVTIRAAAAHDAAALGEIHVRAWRAAYAESLPADYLAALDPSERAAMWQRSIAARGDHDVAVVVQAEEVVGFACWGPDRDAPDDKTTGELYAINLDPRRWRQGLGTALLRHVTERLVERGFTSAVLWVASDNHRAQAFYERERWGADGASRSEEVLGGRLEELRFRRPLATAVDTGAGPPPDA